MEASHILLELYVSLSQKKHDDVHFSPRRMIPPVTLRAECSLVSSDSHLVIQSMTSFEEESGKRFGSG